MVIKVNFSPTNSTAPNDYIVDFGAAYSAEQGYGWVEESTLESETPTPIDISPNTRERSGGDDLIEDTFIHLQYPTDLSSPLGESSIRTPAAWEYDIANGSYLVTVGVGDSDFIDSSHTINIEGESTISDFVPTEDNLFAETTTLVEVTDGTLTLDAIGGDNTKLTFVEIAPADAGNTGGEDEVETPVDTGDTDSEQLNETVKVNFAPASAFSADGYTPDIGAEYSDERGFGWITEDSVGSDSPTPINISPNTRDRNDLEEDNFDSLIHLQYADAPSDNSNSIRTAAAWEYELANGEYSVTVSVGDPDFVDSNHVINIEGNSIISGFAPTEDQRFAVRTATVEVTDGRLTVDAIGGRNTKLNFIEFTAIDRSEIVNNPVEVSPIEIPTNVPIPVEGGGVVETVFPIENGININFGTATVNPPNGFTQDIGAAYNDGRGYGWVTGDSAGTDNPTPIDLFANARDRNTQFNDGQGSVFEEPIRDSLIHLQYPTGLGNSERAVTTPVAWEYALADGRYEVTVGVGDPDFVDSNHVINIEGESAIAGFVPTGSIVNGSLPLGAEAFSTGTAIVDVNDGRLTVDATGGENTKINYISIAEVNDV